MEINGRTLPFTTTPYHFPIPLIGTSTNDTRQNTPGIRRLGMAFRKPFLTSGPL
jgi:hypothetical protein